MLYKENFKSFALAAVLGFGLIACGGGGGGGGGGSGTGMTTTTTALVNGSSQTITTVASVANTGTKGTTASSLLVADKISVVSSSNSTAAPKALHIIKSLDGLVSVKAVPTTWASTVDYNADQTFTYVHERSSKSLNTPNEILCMMAQAKYDAMINKGSYRAQIDKNQCNSAKDSASQASNSASGSSGANAPDYRDWIVISNRKDDTSPQVVSVWMHEDMGGGGSGGLKTKALIYAKVVIGESASATNPYGLFTMNFLGYPLKPDGTPNTAHEMMHGYLRTVILADGKVVLQFYNTQTKGTLTVEEAATLFRASDGSIGSGEAKFPSDAMNNGSSPPTTVTYQQMRFAYDAATFQRTAVNPANSAATGTAICLDKNPANYLTSVWSYGLYDSAGARKTLNSGFPIVYTDTTVTPSVDYYGYVGYWGLWFQDNLTLPKTATVKKLHWFAGAPVKTTYTAKQTDGKLTKHTRNATTLDKIQNVPLNYSMCTQSGSTFTCNNFEAKWDGVKFAITQKMGSTGYTPLSGTDPTVIDVSALSYSSKLNMWSQALGGQVMIQFPVAGCAKSGGWNAGTSTWTQETYDCTGALTSPSTVHVVYYQEKLLLPGDLGFNLALKCFNNCPRGSQFTSTATGSVFYADPMGMMTAPTGIYPYTGFAKSYTYSDTAYTLTDNATATGGAVGLTAQNTNLTDQYNNPLTYGIKTGALFDPAATDAATGKTYAELLKCPWDATAWGSGAQVCPWQANQVLPVYYSWQTGWNNWNYLTVLLDPANNNTPVPFDQPIHVSYTYPSMSTVVNLAATDSKYAGVSFKLEYDGFGQLNGIPGHCVDPDNGANGACDVHMRWVPEFSIPNGEAVVNTSTNPATTYYVKALQQEQRMPHLITACTATLVTYVLPVNTDYTAPDIGTEPVITDPPAVIGGVVLKK